MVLIRIVGDNPISRVAQYLFVGVSLGIAFVVVYHQVVRPAVIHLAQGNETAQVIYGVPLLLGLLLLSRITRAQRLSWLANIPLSLVFGIGAALAIGGGILGTIVPQLLDTANAVRPAQRSLAQTVGVVVLALGTIATLSSFYYTVPRETGAGRVVAFVSVIGHWLLIVAFGFFFASAVQTYMSALTERLQFLLGMLR